MSKCLDEIELECYLTGVLKRKDAQRIESHVASCSICLSRLDRARADEVFLAKLGKASEERLPDDLLARLRHRTSDTLMEFESADHKKDRSDDDAQS